MWGLKRKPRAASIGLLCLLIALSLAWSFLTRPVAGTLTGLVLLGAAVVMFSRNIFRQTNPENLVARGITPSSMARLRSMDPGLRREMGAVIPGAVHRRLFGAGTVIPYAGAGGAAAVRMPVRVRPAPRPTSSRPRLARRRDETLHPEATVTLADERRAAGVDDLFAALDRELVGLAPVKKKVAEIGSLLLVDRARQRFGLSASRPNLHMCFTGAPGTGKTTVAMMMADLLRRLGYLEKGHLVHAMRDDLVGEYIGHTAPKTKQVLERAMGGVLFIDEAYSLYRAEDSKDYGQECIDILMQVMENQRDKLVVILAGYKDRMDRFFDSNPGMSSRVAHHLDFADYDVDELLSIGQLMLDRTSYYLSDEAEATLRDYLSVRMTQPRFANARSVRNELENARLRHAFRLAADPERHWTKDDLMRLEPSDILP